MDEMDTIDEIKQRPSVSEFLSIIDAKGAKGAASKYGIPLWKAESIELKIRNAAIGAPQGAQDKPAESTASPLAVPRHPPSPTSRATQAVIVTDIKMPFGSMVEFMVKWAIASIPAIIILFLIGFGITVVLTGMLGLGSRY